MRKISPLDPVYLKGFNDGRKDGAKEAVEKFNAYLIDRMQTLEEIEGVREKTAWKIHKHLLDGMEGRKETNE